MNYFKKARLAVAAAVAMMLSLPAGAVVVVDAESGWKVSFDGNINQFYVWTDPEPRPAGVIGGNMNLFGGETSRFRTGLVPVIFGFNVKAPTWNGLEMGARISFAAQTNSADTFTDLDSQIEFYDAFFTIDGTFGQILFGQTLSLFMGKNILTDQTLFGVGTASGVNGEELTLGRIGYGYLYPGFNPQIRWTSPNMMGFKVSLAGVDPSPICGDGFSNPIFANPNYVSRVYSNCLREMDAPRFEGEISYAGTFENGSGSYQFWGAGMWQNAKRDPISWIVPGRNVDVWGWTVGTQVQYRNFELTGSYYQGEGLGTSFLLGVDSLDTAGRKRDNEGWLIQGGYTFMGRTKLVVSYGQSGADETRCDKFLRTGTAPFCQGPIGFQGARIAEQRAYVVGIYHDVNAHLKLVAEYSRLENEWHGGQEQGANVVGVGGYFFW